jgi:DNA-binding MarR family transcriptional regulator
MSDPVTARARPTDDVGDGRDGRDRLPSLDDLLFLLVDRTRVAFLRRLEQHGLSMPQAFTLRLLDRPQPMRCLAEAMRCDASNLTGIADRLEQRGLLERRTDPQDRRVKLLVVTPQGQQLRLALHEGMWTDLPGAARLAVAQREQLTSLLWTLLADDEVYSARLGGADPR